MCFQVRTLHASCTCIIHVTAIWVDTTISYSKASRVQAVPATNVSSVRRQLTPLKLWGPRKPTCKSAVRCKGLHAPHFCRDKIGVPSHNPEVQDKQLACRAANKHSGVPRWRRQ